MADVIINFFHLLATSVWIGGALFIKIVLEPALKKTDPSLGGKIMGNVAPRFSIAAWTSLIILIVTGLLKTPSDMLFSADGETETYLMLKHVAIIVVLIIGVLIAFIIVPKMNSSMPKPGERPSDNFLNYSKQLQRLSLTSTVLGIIILILASLLW